MIDALNNYAEKIEQRDSLLSKLREAIDNHSQVLAEHSSALKNANLHLTATGVISWKMTDKEQLIAIRKDIIFSKMAGKTEAEKERAVKYLDRMEFNDQADFTAYVAELTGGEHEAKATLKEATESEIDDIMGSIMPGYRKQGKGYAPKTGEASAAEIDEVFKHMNI